MNIRMFLKKHTIVSIDLKKYGNVTIDRMNRIVSGMVEPTYDHPTLSRLAGLYFMSEKNYDQAERYYQIAINQGDVCAIANIGTMYRYQKKYDMAEQYYLNAIEKGNIIALTNLGLLYYTQKKYDQAERYYLMAVERCELCAPNNLGILYYDQKKYDQAE
jgi:tetratricopeptide (TPR) repeat protein